MCHDNFNNYNNETDGDDNAYYISIIIIGIIRFIDIIPPELDILGKNLKFHKSRLCNTL